MLRTNVNGFVPVGVRFALLGLVALGGCARANVRTGAEPSAAVRKPTAQSPAPRSPSGAGSTSPVQPVLAQAGATPSTPARTAPAKTAPAPVDSAHVDSIEVARLAANVFGDSVAAPAPDDDSATSGPSWDIEVRSYESTARVEHYVRYFTGPARERIQTRLQKGTRYEPMIRAKMRAAGLPEDMYYLALVESGFDPHAYSRAAAVGMWQFMTSTARDMGMRVDWWIDERRDPVRSTSGAVRFIRGLREQFGSLYLAAAAYNGGPGRVARGLSRYADDLEGTTGEDVFFALAATGYLRNETKEYVPQLIAAALVAKEPQRYGMELVPEPPFAYDSVRVGPGTPLAAIAKAAGARVAEIQELNPHVLRGVTPPRDSFLVRVPVGRGDEFADALAALPKEDRVGLRTVESKKGESVATIARRAGISTKALGQFNPSLKRLKSGNLAPGQRLVVPTPAVTAAAIVVPNPAIERYPTYSSRSSKTHVVRSGETLTAIAKKYHTTTVALMKANRLRRALVFPGQSLVVRVAKK
jgi:membrane-bound lytic murein transglycosylase D